MHLYIYMWETHFWDTSINPTLGKSWGFAMTCRISPLPSVFVELAPNGNWKVTYRWLLLFPHSCTAAVHFKVHFQMLVEVQGVSDPPSCMCPNKDVVENVVVGFLQSRIIAQTIVNTTCFLVPQQEHQLHGVGTYIRGTQNKSLWWRWDQCRAGHVIIWECALKETGQLLTLWKKQQGPTGIGWGLCI